MTPSGEKGEITSITRNCLCDLIRYGTRSASIINKHLAEFGLESSHLVASRRLHQSEFEGHGASTGNFESRLSSLTLTSTWGKGPLEFSGTLMGGMTQSLFCLLSPLAAAAPPL